MDVTSWMHGTHSGLLVIEDSIGKTGDTFLVHADYVTALEQR